MSLISSPVGSLLTMEDPVREEGYMVAEGENGLSVYEMEIVRNLDRWVIVCTCMQQFSCNQYILTVVKNRLL